MHEGLWPVLAIIALVAVYTVAKVIARARNRRHAHKLMDLGIEHIFRETLLSSLAMSEVVLAAAGMDSQQVSRVSASFRERDERLLREQHAIHDSEEKLIQSAKETALELESLLQEDTARRDT